MLIAVGATITANCQSCLQTAVETALKSGISEQEIAIAIEIGKVVRKSAAYKMDGFAVNLVQVESAKNEGCPFTKHDKTTSPSL